LTQKARRRSGRRRGRREGVTDAGQPGRTDRGTVGWTDGRPAGNMGTDGRTNGGQQWGPTPGSPDGPKCF
jgi:hypothetical protein